MILIYYKYHGVGCLSSKESESKDNINIKNCLNYYYANLDILKNSISILENIKGSTSYLEIELKNKNNIKIINGEYNNYYSSLRYYTDNESLNFILFKKYYKKYIL